MNDSARYVKIVEWSDGDHCYVVSAPGLIYGGCHGDNERAVFDELCQIVEEVVDVYRRDGRPLPPPTSGRDFVNKALRTILDAMPVRRSKRRRR
jgi:predicted RNase H-like HicB family nuclease